MKDKNSIDFVSRHYRRDAFDESRGWKRLGIKRFRWSAFKVAASIAGLVAVSATAAIIYRELIVPQPQPVQEQQTTPPSEAAQMPTQVVRAIDFDNASLTDVIAKINEVYGISVTNLPANADSYRLSLHYEGNVVELVETINDILDTELTIKE